MENVRRMIRHNGGVFDDIYRHAMWAGSERYKTIRGGGLYVWGDQVVFVGSNEGLDDSAVSIKPLDGVSKSATVKASVPEAVSSLMTSSGMLEIVGGSLRPLTVTLNDVLLLETPSLALNVMVAMPVWLVAGRTRMARLLPPPPTVRLALGISSVFPDEAMTVMPPAGISGCV